MRKYNRGTQGKGPNDGKPALPEPKHDVLPPEQVEQLGSSALVDASQPPTRDERRRAKDERAPSSGHQPEVSSYRAGPEQAFDRTMASVPQKPPPKAPSKPPPPPKTKVERPKKPVEKPPEPDHSALANFIDTLEQDGSKPADKYEIAESKLTVEYDKLKRAYATNRQFLQAFENLFGEDSTTANRNTYLESLQNKAVKPIEQHIADMCRLKEYVVYLKVVMDQEERCEEQHAMKEARRSNAPPSNPPSQPAVPSPLVPQPAAPVPVPAEAQQTLTRSIAPKVPKSGKLAYVVKSPFTWALVQTGIFTASAYYSDWFKQLGKVFADHPALVQTWNSAHIPGTKVYMPWSLDSASGAMTAYLITAGVAIATACAVKLYRVRKHAKQLARAGYNSERYERMRNYVIENLYEVMSSYREQTKPTNIRMALINDLRLFYYVDIFRQNPLSFGSIMKVCTNNESLLRNISKIIDAAESEILKKMLIDYVMSVRNPELRRHILGEVYFGSRENPHRPLKPGVVLSDSDELEWITHELFSTKLDQVFAKSGPSYVYPEKRTELMMTLGDGVVDVGQKIVDELEMDYIVMTRRQRG